METEAGNALTLDDFVALPEEEGYRLELSAGRLVREPAPGPRHGNLAARIAILLHREGEAKGFGATFVHTGFTLARDPDTVRVPDVAFVSAERLPEDPPGDAFWELGPDLAVEIVSPSNTVSGMQTKALECLEAGARLVWVVDPGSRSVTVYRSRTEIRILRPGEVLDAGEVMPEARIPVDGLFD